MPTLVVPLLFVGALLAVPADAAEPSARTLEVDDLRALTWRSIGPANMGGRVATIATVPGDQRTFYVGYATGGVWKTTNAGTTFTPIFDDHETASIGAIAVADAPEVWPGWTAETTEDDDASAEDERGRGRIVWVGTGEGNGRNSSSWGHGVYRSTDAGATFTHLGLEETHDIPALAVDPRDPDVCFVAALGHLWGPNDERGVYRTTDGGVTWSPVLRLDADTGACDVVIDPAHPDTVYAAMYARRRTPWSYRSGGPEGGVYRSNDGGDTWTKLTTGLPARTGRIGLDLHRADPRLVYAVIESDGGGLVGDAFSDRMRVGGVFRSEDGGDTWIRVSDFNPRAFYFSRIRVDPVDAERVYLLGWSLYVSDDGGRTFRGGTAKVPHVDFHAMVVDASDPQHLLIGTDGGLYESWDRGTTWAFHNHMAVGQFYNVTVDDSDPYRVGGGLQDNGTWIGPSETLYDEKGEYWGRAGGITNADWRFVLGGDGFHTVFDPTDEHVVYAEWQGGQLVRTHLDTGVRRKLRPVAREGEPRLRFNWNAPFLVSAHEPTTLYFGGNCVFKLTERGDRWTRISDDLSTQALEKVTTVGSEAETHGTVVSLAESPLTAGVLWAGTDDGRIHLTTDDGATWTDVTPDDVRGLYVSKIEPSRHAEGTAYVAIDGHRSDVFTPILLATGDRGGAWRSIAGDLPDGAPPKVVREDPRNPRVLYVGTERAAYVTIDGGTRWLRLNGTSLPTVAVDDLVVHARAMDLVAGTHGRSIYVLDDVSPLSQFTPEVLASALHVFTPMPAQPRYRLDYGGLWSDQMFVAKNPPVGAVLTYWIREYDPDEVEVEIEAGAGNTRHVVRTLKGTTRPGLNRVVWDLLPDKKQRLGDVDGRPEFVPAGDYRVTVKQGDRTTRTTLIVRPAPGAGDAGP